MERNTRRPGSRYRSGSGHPPAHDQWLAVHRSVVLSFCESLEPGDALTLLLLHAVEPEDLHAFVEDVLIHEIDQASLSRAHALQKCAPRELASAVRALMNRSDIELNYLAVPYLRERLSRCAAAGGTVLTPRVASEIAGLLDLSDEEIAILVVLHSIQESGDLQGCLRDENGREALRAVARSAGCSVAEFSELTRHGSRLHNYGLIQYRGHRDSWDDINLSAPLMYSFTSGGIHDLRAGLFGDERRAAYVPEEFSVPRSERDVMAGILKRRGSLLLSGRPGVGKTEFAYALAESLGKRIRALTVDASGLSMFPSREANSRDRLLLTRMAQSLINPQAEVLLIDEADALLQGAGGFLSLLGGGNYDKAELNQLLDELKVPSIWITNTVSRIPASAMRRFGHVYDFPRPDLRTRERMLSERLRQQEIVTDPRFARNTAQRYDLSPAAIERLVSVMKDTDEPDAVAQKYLLAASSGALADEHRSLPAPSGQFDPQLCAAEPAAEELLAHVARRSESGRGVRLLLSGPAGGGKTQFALYLAVELGREAMLRRPSDLLSPFVGVAEKQIAAMFREASQTGAVLVLDEADALLGNRANARRSWELSQAAEFLQGIQEFTGILIACTNRVEHIDPALRRRFHRHAHFGALPPEMLPAALERFFPQYRWAADSSALRRLSAGPALMMSDIATAADLLEFTDAGECGRPADSRPAETRGSGHGRDQHQHQHQIVQEILANATARDMTRSIGF